MNKQDLIARIVKEAGTTKSQASRIVGVVLASVTKASAGKALKKAVN